MEKERDFSGQWRRFFWIAGLFAAFVLLLYLKFVFSRQPGGTVKSPVPVRAVSVEAEEIELFHTVVAKVEGERSVKVLSGARGFVAGIEKARGSSVKKDEIIMLLDNSRHVYELREAGGLFSSAKSEYEEARRKYEQYKRLFDKGVVSKDDLDSAQNAFRGAESRMEALDASYGKAEWYVKRLKVRSPTDGKVVEVLPDVGQEVAEGEVVARVSGGRRNTLVASVDSSVAKGAGRGSKVYVEYKTPEGKRTAAGTVKGVSAETDSGSTTYSVEISVEDGAPLWPGEFVNVRIRSGLLAGVTRLPVTALLYDNKEPFVFIAKRGKAVKLPLEGGVVRLDSGTAAVAAGQFPRGSLVITEGNSRLAAGRPVKVLKDR